MATSLVTGPRSTPEHLNEEKVMMPRIRSIKPDFFTSDTVSALPLRARLTWIGLWTHCDDYGRCRDNVRLVKAAVWPLDNVSLRDVADDLEELVKANVVFRYTAGDKGYLQVTNWLEHQKVDHPSKSPIPPPEEPRETLARPREELSNPRAGREGIGNGREGTRAPARDAPPPEPPTRCRQHLTDDVPPPCGGCGSARRAHDRWEREMTAWSAAAPRCERHRGQPASNCANCRSESVGAA